MEVICSFHSPPFDFSSNIRYVHEEGQTKSDKSTNNELRPLFAARKFKSLIKDVISLCT